MLSKVVNPGVLWRPGFVQAAHDVVVLRSCNCQDAMLQRRVVAGLVAYVSILQHGSVRVQLRDGKGTLGRIRSNKSSSRLTRC